MKTVKKKQKPKKNNQDNQNKFLKQLFSTSNDKSIKYTTSDLRKYSRFEQYQMFKFKHHMEYGKKKHPTWSDLKYFSRMRMWYVHKGYMNLYSWFMKFRQPMSEYGLITEHEYRKLIEIQDILNDLMSNRKDQYNDLKKTRFQGVEMILPYNNEEVIDDIFGHITNSGNLYF